MEADTLIVPRGLLWDEGVGGWGADVRPTPSPPLTLGVWLWALVTKAINGDGGGAP